MLWLISFELGAEEEPEACLLEQILVPATQTLLFKRDRRRRNGILNIPQKARNTSWWVPYYYACIISQSISNKNVIEAISKARYVISRILAKCCVECHFISTCLPFCSAGTNFVLQKKFCFRRNSFCDLLPLLRKGSLKDYSTKL